MKNILYLTLTLLVFLSGCTECKEKEDCISGNLQFDLPVQVYGVQDTLDFGDTLRIKFDIPDKMAERNSGESFAFNDYNFKLITYMVKIDSSPATANSITSFDWITVTGESKYESGVFLVMPTYTDHAYHYEVKIIPKQKGMFVFGMNSDFSRNSPLEKLTGPCYKGDVEAYMKLTNDPDVNFEFLKHSPDLSQANTDRKRFDEYAGFCFYVL